LFVNYFDITNRQKQQKVSIALHFGQNTVQLSGVNYKWLIRETDRSPLKTLPQQQATGFSTTARVRMKNHVFDTDNVA